jgi:hypothetical protein
MALQGKTVICGGEVFRRLIVQRVWRQKLRRTGRKLLDLKKTEQVKKVQYEARTHVVHWGPVDEVMCSELSNGSYSHNMPTQTGARFPGHTIYVDLSRGAEGRDNSGTCISYNPLITLATQMGVSRPGTQVIFIQVCSVCTSQR